MIQSMTGYGSAESEKDQYLITVEIKSLNSKFADISLRLSNNLTDKDIELRNLISTLLKRGKINVNIDLQLKTSEGQANDLFNITLFKAYYRQFDQLSDELGADKKDLMRMAVSAPDVMKVVKDKLDESVFEEVTEAVKLAARQCINFRQDEGKRLAEELSNYIANISGLLDDVRTTDKSRVERVKQRIYQNIADLKVEVDQNRLEQEIVYYVEKLDITEEIIRLDNHLKYFLESMNQNESNGKKLGFIAQEIGREINTIGSKANDGVLQQIVVNMKDELEKIKEQSLNIM